MQHMLPIHCSDDYKKHDEKEHNEADPRLFGGHQESPLFPFGNCEANFSKMITKSISIVYGNNPSITRDEHTKLGKTGERWVKKEKVSKVFCGRLPVRPSWKTGNLSLVYTWIMVPCAGPQKVIARSQPGYRHR
jgi:hypothetical protein